MSGWLWRRCQVASACRPAPVSSTKEDNLPGFSAPVTCSSKWGPDRVHSTPPASLTSLQASLVKILYNSHRTHKATVSQLTLLQARRDSMQQRVYVIGFNLSHWSLTVFFSVSKIINIFSKTKCFLNKWLEMIRFTHNKASPGN